VGYERAMSTRPLTLGAVAYDPKVVTIWEGFKAWFESRGLAFDYRLFSTYEAQVEAHLRGELDVAWNSPLAWLQSERAAKKAGRRAHAVAMRDTDQDLTSVIVVPTGSPVRAVSELRGKRVGVGAADSPQATLIPLLLLAEQGLEPGRDFEVARHDVLLGKHGDHIGGERDAVRALLAGKLDAACLIDGNLLGFGQDGTLPQGAVRVLAQTAKYDHCVFTAFDGFDGKRFVELLLSMKWEDAAVRRLLELEGLRAWRPGRTEGFAQLGRAIDRFHTLDAWLAQR
jgi:ABC-type phosphate/phosphonate transport system substrate-binding protein